MWMTNENITQFTLEFYKVNQSGAEEQFYTILLEDARIAGIRFEQPDTRDAVASQLPITEQITLVYSKITLTHESTGNTATEDLSTL